MVLHIISGGGVTLIGGTSYKINKGKTLINGTGQNITFQRKASDLNLGDTVHININSIKTAFTVVDKSHYDGIMLFANDIYTTMEWFHGWCAYYHYSNICNYLETTFLSYLPSYIVDNMPKFNVRDTINSHFIAYDTYVSPPALYHMGFETVQYPSSYELAWDYQGFKKELNSTYWALSQYRDASHCGIVKPDGSALSARDADDDFNQMSVYGVRPCFTISRDTLV